MSEQTNRCNWCNQILDEDATWFFCCDKIHCSHECANCTFQLNSSHSPVIPASVLSSSPLIDRSYSGESSMMEMSDCTNDGIVNTVINLLVEGWNALEWSESGEVY